MQRKSKKGGDKKMDKEDFKDILIVSVVCNFLVFFLSWLISIGCYITHFTLTTELGTYSELTLPSNVAVYYNLLSAQLGLKIAIYISIPSFFILFIIFFIYTNS